MRKLRSRRCSVFPTVTWLLKLQSWVKLRLVLGPGLLTLLSSVPGKRTDTGQCWCDTSNLLERLLEPLQYGWVWATQWEMQGKRRVSEEAGGPLWKQMVKRMLPNTNHIWLCESSLKMINISLLPPTWAWLCSGLDLGHRLGAGSPYLALHE